MKDYTYYKNCFCNLHTAKQRGFHAPHKPLLLLSVIDMVERGVIRSNRIELSDELVNAFNLNTAKYIGHSALFSPNIGQPFYHMQHEPFWKLVPAYSELDMAAEPMVGNGKRSVSYSLGALRSNYRYAQIDDELFCLLKDGDVRAGLRVALIGTYFSSQPSSLSPLAVIPTCLALVSLIA